MTNQNDWYVLLTETGIDSVWPSQKQAEDWNGVLSRRGLIHDAVVVPFDSHDEAHLMAATFSPQLNQGI